MIMVRLVASSRVGQVTFRNSARVSLKYFTTGLSLRGVDGAALDFDFATLIHAPLNSDLNVPFVMRLLKVIENQKLRNTQYAAVSPYL
jgi:hypothetical protein